MNHILFDLDGTLADPKVGITKSFEYALNSFGIAADPDSLTHFIGPPLRASFAEHYGFDQAQTERAVAKYREYFREHGIFENQIYDGVPEMLRELQSSGYTIALATSKLEAYAQQILEHFGIARYFAFVCGDTPEGSRSGKAEIIRRILGHLRGITPENAVMVGDRKHDIIHRRQSEQHP
jgi:phosphoglycolate phosphatase